MNHRKRKRIQKNIYFCFIDYAKVFACVGHNKLWKILKQMGIPDHLTCLPQKLYSGQKAIIRTGHGTTDWFQIRKGVCKAASCHPASVQFSSVAQSCPTLCNPMNCSTPGLPVHHHFLEFTQTHVH